MIRLVDNIGDYISVLAKKYPNMKIKDYSDTNKILIKSLFGNSSFFENSVWFKFIKGFFK